MGNETSSTVAPAPGSPGGEPWTESDVERGGAPGGGAAGARQVRWGTDTEQRYGGAHGQQAQHHGGGQYGGAPAGFGAAPQQDPYYQSGGGYVSDGGSYYAEPPQQSHAGGYWSGGGAYQSSPPQGGYYAPPQQQQQALGQQRNAAAAAPAAARPTPEVVKKVTAFVFKLLPNFGSNPEHDTIVMQAIASDQVDVRARDKKGNTLLLLAAKGGIGPVVQVLVQRGVSMGDQNSAGQSALHFAACGGVMGDKVAGEASTPGEGGYAGRTELARLLLESGVPPQLIDKAGFTALHSAVCYGGAEDEALVELLLEFGAGVTLSAADTSGYTAIEWAKHEGKSAIVARLQKEAGASAVMIVATPTPAGGLLRKMDYGISDDDEDDDAALARDNSQLNAAAGRGSESKTKAAAPAAKTEQTSTDEHGLEWQKHFDDESQVWFEYCERTGESRWIEEDDVPPGTPTPKSPGGSPSSGRSSRSGSPNAPKRSIAMLAKAKLNLRAKALQARKSIIARALAGGVKGDAMKESLKNSMKGQLNIGMINASLDSDIARATHVLAARDNKGRGGGAGAGASGGPPTGAPPGALAALSPSSEGLRAAEARAAEHRAASAERDRQAELLLSPKISAAGAEAASKAQAEEFRATYRKSLLRLWRSSARSVGARVVRERKVRFPPPVLCV
jgi:hypothetical protein